jgi:hypothetical protein
MIFVDTWTYSYALSRTETLKSINSVRYVLGHDGYFGKVDAHMEEDRLRKRELLEGSENTTCPIQIKSPYILRCYDHMSFDFVDPITRVKLSSCILISNQYTNKDVFHNVSLKGTIQNPTHGYCF